MSCKNPMGPVFNSGVTAFSKFFTDFSVPHHREDKCQFQHRRNACHKQGHEDSPFWWWIQICSQLPDDCHHAPCSSATQWKQPRSGLPCACVLVWFTHTSVAFRWSVLNKHLSEWMNAPIRNHHTKLLLSSLQEFWNSNCLQESKTVNKDPASAWWPSRDWAKVNLCLSPSHS